jgi:superfamily I DNA/RNA helicase
MKITDEQNTIIESHSGDKIIVEAGPGTGKTEVVARRLSWIIGGNGGLWPSRILVLSFSRSAVKALIQRIRNIELTDKKVVEDLRHLSVRTFDSWSFRQLRFLGYEPNDLLRHSYDYNIRQLINEFSKRDRNEILDDPNLRFNRIKHIIIDEFQDLTGLRAYLVYQLLSILAPPDTSSVQNNCGFTILGDPNQAIYEYLRGESNDNAENMTSLMLLDWLKTSYKDTVRLCKLSQNYRSTKTVDKIVKKSVQILNKPDINNFQELHKFAKKVCPTYDIIDIAMKIENASSDSKIAILCRTRSEAIDTGLDLEENSESINFLIDISRQDRESIIPSWIAKIFYRFEQKQITHSNFKRIYKVLFPDNNENIPCNGDSDATWQMLLHFTRKSPDEKSISMDQLRERILWRDSLPDDEGEVEPNIIITTIHKSKGLEFDKVHIVRDEKEGKIKDQNDQNEEARVLFVGMSRAKSTLSMLELDQGKSFYPKTFKKGNSEWQRWHRWFKNGIQQLEIGIAPDVDESSFVSKELFETESQISEYQNFLSENEKDLIGREIVLEKTKLEGPKMRFVYNICLKEPLQNIRILGRTRPTLTLDLLSLKHENQTLPKNIYGLKIRSVVTVIGKEIDQNIPTPWSISRIWLGVYFHGIGQYKMFWKKR